MRTKILVALRALTPDHQLMNHVVEEGAPLCYVSVDEERGLVYGANYHKGQVLSYRIHEDGHLTLVDQATHQVLDLTQTKPVPMFTMQISLLINCSSLVI